MAELHNKRWVEFLLAGVLLLAPGYAQAIPVTYFYEVTGTGTIGGVPFESPVTFIARGDTGSVSPTLSVAYDGEIVIAGLGAFTLAPTSFSVLTLNLGSELNYGIFPSVVISGLESAVFATWDFSSELSLAPVSGEAVLQAPPVNGPVMTSGGDFLLESILPQVRFRSSVATVPVPATGALLLGALALVAATARQRVRNNVRVQLFGARR